MIAPVTSVTVTRQNSAANYYWISYQKQKPPYNLQLPFSAIKRKWVQHYGTQSSFVATSGWSLDSANGQVGGDPLGGARNRAYARLVGKLGDSSQLGSTLTAERRETWGTLVILVTRALRSAKAIRKLNFSQAARELGLPYHERTVVKRYRVRPRRGSKRNRVISVRRTYFDWGTGRERVKTLANGWLMWSYGIKPVMQDSYNCIDILQRPFPWERVTGSSTHKSSRLDVYKPPSYFPGSLRRDLTVHVKQSIEVRVDNPNLWLANRLGLVNPIQWVNEAIPFSFVADWFSNLSEVISSLTDFVGLQTRDPCVNTRGLFVEDSVGSNPYNTADNRHWHETRTSVFTSRSTSGLATPKLRFAYERFQWQRGLNAISLLVGFLRK